MSRTYESPTRKAQAEETRIRILRALVDLMVEERPATISVPQVAKRAGVSVRIVYHYFPSKDALFEGLVEAIPSLLVQPQDADYAHPTSPAQLAEATPEVFRYLAANRDIFRALRMSEFSEQVEKARSRDRAERTDSALAPLADQLDAHEYKLLHALIGALTSFDGYNALTTVWGLDTADAGEAVSWAVRVLADRARRSGVKGVREQS
jgi:AcrR family transcriptional regulator